MNEIEKVIELIEAGEIDYSGIYNAEFNQKVSMVILAALRERAERAICAECKHYNRTGCSEGFGWCESMDRGTHDEFYCACGKRLEVKHD
jgi:hypothetical protein